jgi:predicted NodU family carbamoyl transferase/SAM-dependent methyltransferase
MTVQLPSSAQADFHLGINVGHDRSAAIASGGRLLVAIEEERLDRHKHSPGLTKTPNGVSLELPFLSIQHCLDALGLRPDQLASVTANTPGVDVGPRLAAASFPGASILEVPSHHLAHAYSAWWPSGLDDAIVLVVDATGKTSADGLTESYTVYRGTSTDLELVHSEQVPAELAGMGTLGMLYEEVTRRIGFITRMEDGLSHAEAGKTMGLAPYGGASSVFERWIHTRPGEFSLEIPGYDIFLELQALEKTYGGGSGRPWMMPHLVELSAKVQSELEEALLHIVRVAKEKTGLNRLCLAGGVALNSVANHRVVRELGLDAFFAFPAAGDSGIAAGCALWASATQGKGPAVRLPIGHAYFGGEAKDASVESACEQYAGKIQWDRLPEAELIERTAQALAAGRIVARHSGGAEYGPRALGNRSILADPTFAQMRDVLNLRVKHREAYRPFAPVVPRDQAEQVFELGVDSPFMLLVAPVREDMRSVLPAITHHDGTGRVQTVTKEDNPFFDGLCRRLSEIRGGPPVILNTSFNLAGEPMVEAAADALSSFMATDIDHLVLNGRWISKAGAAPKDYEEHIRNLPESSDPKGLAADAPTLTPLVESLHRALSGEANESEWSGDEIAALQSEAGRLRPTSRRFPAQPDARSMAQPPSVDDSPPTPLTSPHPAPGQGTGTLAVFTEEQPQLARALAPFRSQLRAAGYTESGVADRLGKTPQEIEPTDLPYFDTFLLARAPLDDLIRLFQLRGVLAEDRARALFGSETYNLLFDLGILRVDMGSCRSRVDLFPVEDLVVATDHRYQVLDGDALDEDPVMYLGLDSVGLVKAAPRRQSKSHLDLCTGSGVQALVAATYSERVTGVDLNPRALRFSRFNAALNGVSHARFIESDLYAAVDTERFDSITANPPFVPSPTEDLAFRDGGADGEKVLRRIVMEAAQHLNPGGRLAIVTDLAEPKGYEAKLGGWWKGQSMCAQVLTTADRNEILFSVPHSHAPFGQSYEEYSAELRSWVRSYREAGLSAVNFGYILIEETAHDGPHDTLMRVVDSPQQPIFERVENLLAFQAQRSRGALSAFDLSAVEGLVIRTERKLSGQGALRTAIVPDSPWHTEYTLDGAMLGLLEDAACEALRWDEVEGRGLAGHALALIEKGLLVATPGVRASSPKTERIMIIPRKAIHIEELSSKTTPTCVSNYLR